MAHSWAVMRMHCCCIAGAAEGACAALTGRAAAAAAARHLHAGAGAAAAGLCARNAHAPGAQVSCMHALLACFPLRRLLCAYLGICADRSWAPSGPTLLLRWASHPATPSADPAAPLAVSPTYMLRNNCQRCPAAMLRSVLCCRCGEPLPFWHTGTIRPSSSVRRASCLRRCALTHGRERPTSSLWAAAAAYARANIPKSAAAASWQCLCRQDG